MTDRTSLNKWQRILYELETEKGWNEVPRPIPESIALIHSEASEALEEYRMGLPTNAVYYLEDANGVDKPEGFPIEIADIVIRCLGLAEHLGFDLEEMMQIKHEYNKTRPYRHGGKLA